jgi:hypothetical protein
MAFGAFVAEFTGLGLPLGRPHLGQRRDLARPGCRLDQAKRCCGDLDLLLQVVWSSRCMTEWIVKKRSPRGVGAGGDEPRRAQRGGWVTQGFKMTSDQSN